MGDQVLTCSCSVNKLSEDRERTGKKELIRTLKGVSMPETPDSYSPTRLPPPS